MTSKRAGNSSPMALDRRTRTVHNQEVPELDPNWMEDVQFMQFSPLPLQFQQDDLVIVDQASLEEWTENVNFMCEDLKRLLCFPHNKFWCQVIFDETLQQSLDSFLKFSPRDFDMLSSLPAEVSELLATLCQRVFMSYLRMSTHKESKDDFITPAVFGEILYENFIFDIPKLMDICVLYGGDQSQNTPLLRKMVDNIFSKQPKYYDDLNGVIPTICETLDNILIKCGLSQEGDSPLAVPERLDNPSKATQLTSEALRDVVLYLTDTFQTLFAFLHTLPSLCRSFHRHSFVIRVATFFESFASLMEETRQNQARTARGMWRTAKGALFKLCHVILHTCCIMPLQQSTGPEQLQNSVEDYLEVLMAVLSCKRFLSGYNAKFSINGDLQEMTRSAATLDETRANFIRTAVESACEAFPSQLGKTTKVNKTRKKMVSVSSPLTSSSNQERDFAVPNGTAPSKEAGAAVKTVDDVELVSMVTHIQDILPDLGEGFLIKCLEELNYDVEKVISSLLEDSLPPSLQALGRDLSKEDVMKPRQEEEGVGSGLTDRQSVYDNDEFDVFSRGGVDYSKIHKGKRRDRTKLESLLADKSYITESVKERYSSYDVYGKHLSETDVHEAYDLYDDEYDDTYDTHNVGAQDADPADQLDELKFRRPFTIPRVLGGSPQESSEEEEQEGDGEAATTHAAVPQTSAQQGKRDTQEGRGTRRGAGRGHGQTGEGGKTNSKIKRDVRGRGRGQGVAPDVARNRAMKEKHKANRSNHNRKAGADRKRNKGMGALPPQ